MLNTVVVAVVVIAIFLAVVSAVALRARPTTTEGSPWRESQLSPAINNFLAAFHTAQSETDAHFLEALGQLRSDATNHSQQISLAFGQLDALQFGARRSLLYTARYLAHASSLPFLVEIAKQKPGGELSHEGNRMAEESMLRSIAVDGIEQIARQENSQAVEALMTLCNSSDRLVQASSVVALKYLNVPLDRLRSAVPRDRLYLLDLVRVDIRDVPQIMDPRQHLRAEVAAGTGRPNPESKAEPSRSPDRKSRVPNVSREVKHG